jgi:hypothetical protein
MTADLDQLVKELKALPREKKLRLVERLEQDGFFDDNLSWKKIERGAYEDNQGRWSTTPPGSNGRSLLRFAGSIDINDLMTIQRAIDEGCETVDQEGW